MTKQFDELGPFYGTHVVGTYDRPSGAIGMDVQWDPIDKAVFVFGKIGSDHNPVELFRLNEFEMGFFIRRALEHLL